MVRSGLAEATMRHEGYYTAKKPRLHALADLENLSAPSQFSPYSF